jgi:stage V sporulation protein G
VNITEVRVRRVATGGKLKAFASITIDDVFVVHDLKVIEGQKGLFVAMPSRKTGNGEFKDIAHPIATEARSMIQDKIIGEYNRMLEEEGESPQCAAPVGGGMSRSNYLDENDIDPLDS